jgi:hypothetical protein
VVRLVAVVVAPDVSREAMLAALRERVDAAFLPRRILRIDALPRDGTGKLPSGRLAELAQRDCWRSPAMPEMQPTVDVRARPPCLRRPLPRPAAAARRGAARRSAGGAAARGAGGTLGAQPRVSAVKFLSPVRPGASLEVRWSAPGCKRGCASRCGAMREPAIRRKASSPPAASWKAGA